jgi:predicted DNA-binding protein
MAMKPKSKGIRITTELWKQLSALAENSRPRSTLQYVLEDAVEKYLKEKGVTYDVGTNKKP